MGLRVRGRLTELRRATNADVDLLVAWHADPEVIRYWGNRAYTHEEVVARLRRDDVDSWIVEAEGVPVGYIQSWWDEDEPRRGGLDMFLAPAARGRGLGPDAGRALAQWLLDNGWEYVTVDPYLWNRPAVRAWQRAGFEPVEEGPAEGDHDAPWLLMRFQGADGL